MDSPPLPPGPSAARRGFCLFSFVWFFLLFNCVFLKTVFNEFLNKIGKKCFERGRGGRGPLTTSLAVLASLASYGLFGPPVSSPGIRLFARHAVAHLAAHSVLQATIIPPAGATAGPRGGGSSAACIRALFQATVMPSAGSTAGPRGGGAAAVHRHLQCHAAFVLKHVRTADAV